MSTTITMWLGIAFVLLGITATIIQAWLWSFPMVPDPGGPDPNGKSTAPRFWTQTHRVCGLLFVLIYIVMMVEMVPRLWEYQLELPARTVMHAVMGILLGMLLIAKIAIIRWFQHFGKGLPTLGFLVLVCTVILALLSLPHAVRGLYITDAAAAPKNVERVQRILADLQLGGDIPIAELTTRRNLATGREILASKCTTCHDLRTILAKPRTGKRWKDVVLRMAQKPLIGEPITDRDVPIVTAYLIAITPDIQQSRKKLKDAQEEARNTTAALRKSIASDADAAPEDTQKLLAEMKPIVDETCTECHELSTIEEYHGEHHPDLAGWQAIVTRMVEEEGAELEGDQAARIARYLAAAYGK